MSETFSREVVEQEIAELSEAIRARQAILDKERGLTQERAGKELVKEAVHQKIREIAPDLSSKMSHQPKSVYYLDRLDEEASLKINHLVEEVFAKGLRASLKNLEYQEPFFVDALHDLLVDKYYTELKERGLVK